jgi:hypothetical protein
VAVAAAFAMTGLVAGPAAWAGSSAAQPDLLVPMATINETTGNNNTPATAQAINVGDTVNGSSSSISDLDFYKFTTSAAGRLTINLTFPSTLTSTYAWNLALCKATATACDYLSTNSSRVFRQSVEKTHYNGSPMKDYYIALPAGTWVIGLDPYVTSTYSLGIAFTPGTVEIEDNNAQGTATNLTLGQTISGSIVSGTSDDTDYYKFSVGSTGQLNLSFTYQGTASPDQQYKVKLFKQGVSTALYGWDLTAAEYDGARVAATKMFVGAGTYYLSVVSGYTKALYWGKQYNVKVTHTAGYTEAEPNDASSSATSLALGKTITGSMLAQTGYSDYDYYVVDLPKPGTLVWTLTHPVISPSGEHYAYVRVQDSSGNLVGYEYAENSVTSTTFRASDYGKGLPAGRYFVNVWSSTNTKNTYNTTYGLTVTEMNNYESFTLTPSLDKPRCATCSGDNYGEVVGIFSNGTMHRYDFTASSTLEAKETLVSYTTNDLTGNKVYGPGDWNGDGYADIVTVDKSGYMWLYPGTGYGYVGKRVEIGHGWTPFRIIPAGDLTQDGANDMLAIDAGGRLWLYSGNGKGGWKGQPKQVGQGWIGLELYAAGDLNGDGKNDILAILPDSTLWAYNGRGNGTFGVPKQVGRGWGAFELAAGADLNGDGRADIVGRNNATGELWYYRGNGGGSFQAPKLIGTAW